MQQAYKPIHHIPIPVRTSLQPVRMPVHPMHFNGGAMQTNGALVQNPSIPLSYYNQLPQSIAPSLVTPKDIDKLVGGFSKSGTKGNYIGSLKNRWIQFCQEYGNVHNISYTQAMNSCACSDAYHQRYGTVKREKKRPVNPASELVPPNVQAQYDRIPKAPKHKCPVHTRVPKRRRDILDTGSQANVKKIKSKSSDLFRDPSVKRKYVKKSKGESRSESKDEKQYLEPLPFPTSSSSSSSSGRRRSRSRSPEHKRAFPTLSLI